MTQEQYNRYMDGLVLKVASKKLNKTASFRKRAEKIGVNDVDILIPDIPSTGTGNGADVYQEAANRNAKEVQDYYNNIMEPKKSWLDVAKGYGKQGIDWVKAHPYATAGGVATAALAAGLVGAYLLRKKSKKNTKTASFRKRAYDFPLLSTAIELNKSPELKIKEEIDRAESFNVTKPEIELLPGLNKHLAYKEHLSGTGLGKILNNIRKDSVKPFNPGTSDILTIGQTPKEFTLWDKVKFRAQDAKDFARETYDQGKSWIKENPVKAGLIGAAAVGIPAALIYAYYSRKNNKSKKSKK